MGGEAGPDGVAQGGKTTVPITINVDPNSFRPTQLSSSQNRSGQLYVTNPYQHPVDVVVDGQRINWLRPGAYDYYTVPSGNRFVQYWYNGQMVTQGYVMVP